MALALNVVSGSGQFTASAHRSPLTLPNSSCPASDDSLPLTLGSYMTLDVGKMNIVMPCAICLPGLLGISTVVMDIQYFLSLKALSKCQPPPTPGLCQEAFPDYISSQYPLSPLILLFNALC